MISVKVLFEKRLLDSYICFSMDEKLYNSYDCSRCRKKAIDWFNRRYKHDFIRYAIFMSFHYCPSDGCFRLFIKGFVGGFVDLSDTGARVVSGFFRPVPLEKIQALGISADKIEGKVYTVPKWKYGYSVVYPADSMIKEFYDIYEHEFLRFDRLIMDSLSKSIIKDTHRSLQVAFYDSNHSRRHWK